MDKTFRGLSREGQNNLRKTFRQIARRSFLAGNMALPIAHRASGRKDIEGAAGLLVGCAKSIDTGLKIVTSGGYVSMQIKTNAQASIQGCRVAHLALRGKTPSSAAIRKLDLLERKLRATEIKYNLMLP